MKPNIIFFLIDGGRADKILTNLKDTKLPNIKKLILEKFNTKSLADVITWAKEVRKKLKE